MNTITPTGRIIAFQPVLRPEIPTVFGNVDYQRMEKPLRRIDALIVRSGIDRVFASLSMSR